MAFAVRECAPLWVEIVGSAEFHRKINAAGGEPIRLVTEPTQLVRMGFEVKASGPSRAIRYAIAPREAARAQTALISVLDSDERGAKRGLRSIARGRRLYVTFLPAPQLRFLPL